MKTMDAGDVVSFLRDSLYVSIIYFWPHGFWCCTWVFSSWGEQGYSSLWLLIAVASLVDHGL